MRYASEQLGVKLLVSERDQGGVLTHAFVDRSTAGQEVGGHGQFEFGFVSDRYRLLDRSFADRRSADDEASIPVLNGSSDDFRCTGRETIDEDDEAMLIL